MSEDNAKPFQEMAENIVKNAGASFGGAIVVVPPKDGGDVISILILDKTEDATQLWSLLEARSVAQKNKIGSQSRANQAGYGLQGGRR